MFNVSSFTKIKHIAARISDMGDGDMGLSSNKSLLSDKTSARATYLSKYGSSIKNTVIAGLCHGGSVALVTSDDANTIIPNTDGLLTFETNLSLAITAADCLPIYFISSKVVGIAHAGWRGLDAHIIEHMAQALYGLYVDPRSVEVIIGPHICAKCYEVKQDLVDTFETYGAHEVVEGKSYLDLSKIAIAQARAAGFVHVKDVHVCTREQNFFSARRDGAPLKVQIATIERRNDRNN